jgi:hypothetical protein
MAEFLEKTWFVWWTFAALVILRWFHVISSSRDPEGELQRGEGGRLRFSPAEFLTVLTRQDKGRTCYRRSLV